MKRYIALLRGINISGKNKISMSELKKGFEELGFAEVKTYLNSGNVIFSCDNDDSSIFADKIKQMVKNRFGFDIPVFIMPQEILQEVLNNAPDWWGDDNKEIYDNLIFMFPPLLFEEFYREIGDPKVEYEKVYNYKDVIFWSFSRKDYPKTNWWSRTAGAGISGRITIRTANTVRKIAGM